MERISFFWYDYLIFAIMLIGSSLVGVILGYIGNTGDKKTDYLMGGRKMKVIPIAISLVASHTSGTALLALPAEVYKFGSTYGLAFISLFFVCLVNIFIFLPVFYDLKIISTYEYLEMRFDRKTRKFASILFGLQLLTYLPIVIYLPALTFATASNISIQYITPIVCGICIFCTAIGGIKTVVWSDALRFTITLGVMILVFFLGLSSVGGLSEVWKKSLQGNRLDVFDFDINPTKRETFWAITIGLTIHWVAQVSINQACTQKFLSLPTFKKSKIASCLYLFGLALVKIMCVVTGLIIYTKYGKCDPFQTKSIERNDQLVPYYVMDVSGNIKGLAALFIAGVFCTALSTLSTNINCLAGTIYEDFIVQHLTSRSKRKYEGIYLKLLVISTGVLSTLMVYVIKQQLGGLLSLTIALSSATDGALLGMFLLGLLFPKATAKGAFFGATLAVICMTIIITGNNYYVSQGYEHGYYLKPVSIDQCNFNSTSLLDSTTKKYLGNDDYDYVPFFLFRISFYWNTCIGLTITILSGILVSYFDKKRHKSVNAKLLCPLVRKFVKKIKNVDSEVQVPLNNSINNKI